MLLIWWKFAEVSDSHELVENGDSMVNIVVLCSQISILSINRNTSWPLYISCVYCYFVGMAIFMAGELIYCTMIQYSYENHIHQVLSHLTFLVPKNEHLPHWLLKIKYVEDKPITQSYAVKEQHLRYIWRLKMFSTSVLYLMELSLKQTV